MDYEKTFVEKGNVFELMRSYRQNKYNPGFNQQCINETINDFFLVIYKWKGVGENSQFFEMPRHGNAKNPEVPSYYRQDCSARDEVDNLIEKGMSTEKIYTTLNKQSKFLLVRHSKIHKIYR